MVDAVTRRSGANGRRDGMRDLERQMGRDPESVLRDPERNIQIGCWYLEKLYQQYRDISGAEARMVAGYNAGPSRAADWNRVSNNARPLTADEFVARIDIPSTRAYVTSILERYRKLKESKSRKAAGGQYRSRPQVKIAEPMQTQ